MTYRRIRSLARGIEVLRYLNTVRGAHPVAIGKELGLPRPTVHRILETLEELDLVYQGAHSREFRITPGVRGLTASGGRFSELRAASWPAMRDLTAELDWPSDLAVFQDDAMLIVESTHSLSPLSSEFAMVGQYRSMLVSPLGRTFLSHCSEERRAAIIEALKAKAKPDDQVIVNDQAIDRLVEAGQRDGFSICDDLVHDLHASMAVPVRVGGEVVASLNIVWQVADVSFQDAREQLAAPLLAARDRIEQRLGSASERQPCEQVGGKTVRFYDYHLIPVQAALAIPKRPDVLVPTAN